MAVRLPLSAILLVWLSPATLLAQPPVKAQPPKAAADRLDGPPFVTAKAWAIADGKTGKLLRGSREVDPLAIASTTKIMTAWVVLQLADKEPKLLDEVMTVSERAAKTPGSSAKLKAGDRIPVREMLFGLLLPSGNDAAAALAEHFGSRFKSAAKSNGEPVPLFVAEMNRQARAMKLTETKYLDPHGLGNNQSSARNLAVLASHAFMHEGFRGYVKTRRREYEMTGANDEKRTVVWDNTNRLLGIDGYDGVKTGTTNAAGSCLVASGRRGADHLIVVVLGSTSNDGRYADARNLFRWAWNERAK